MSDNVTAKILSDGRVDESINRRILNVLSRTEPIKPPAIHSRINRGHLNPYVDINTVIYASRRLVDEGRAARVPPLGYIRTGARPT